MSDSLKHEIRARMLQGNGESDFYVKPLDDETPNDFAEGVASIAVESKSFTAFISIENLDGVEDLVLTQQVIEAMKRQRGR